MSTSVRNHTFVENLSRGVVNDTINGGDLAACRAMVMETTAVQKKTIVLIMRVRSVIRDKKLTERELVGEEMLFIGYRGNIDDYDFLTQEEVRSLFLEDEASGSLDLFSQKTILTKSIQWTTNEQDLRKHTDEIALKRASHLVDAFSRYKNYVSASGYQVVEPVLPMDVIVAYVFIPQINI